MLGILLALQAAVPQTTVSAPDSVTVGQLFTVDISISGEEVLSAGCVPAFTGGVEYYGSSTSQSYSSISTPSGTTISSSVNISLSFIAVSQGEHRIGPFTLTSPGMGRMELPGVTVFASTSTLSTRTIPFTGGVTDRPDRSESRIWIQVEVDNSLPFYPGCPFLVDYYACTGSRNVQSIQTSLDGSEYATARMLESPTQLEWRKCGEDIRRSLLLRMEVTPAFACTLGLPVAGGTAVLLSGFFETEITIPPSDEHVLVHPFPETGMPLNFDGIADSISFTMVEQRCGYSLASERILLLTASGPGAGSILSPPEITVSGPATIEPGVRAGSGESVSWQLLVEPADSGSAVFGPDSMAWFDRENLVYRQAVIPACTLGLRLPSATPLAPPLLESEKGGSLYFPILAVVGSVLLIVIMTLRRRSRRSLVRTVEEVSDTEELLTLLERELSRMLTGTSSYMGYEELAEAMEERGVDSILSRRILRHWKDIEMSLSGRGTSREGLRRFRRNTMEVLQDLSSELERASES